MKRNCRLAAMTLGAWFVLAGQLRAQTHSETLLILEVSELDALPAARLGDLLERPSQRSLAPAATDPKQALTVLRSTLAHEAVILDTAHKRVHVIDRQGHVKTRWVEGDPLPTAYLMAFVASELLALDGPAPNASAASDKPQDGLRAARISGRLGLVVGSPFPERWLPRPQLGLDLWLANLRAGGRERSAASLRSRARGRASTLLGLLGLELSGGVDTDVRVGTGQLSLSRWDILLRAGLGVDLGRVRVLVFAQGRMALNRADYSGVFGVAERTISLGIGAGAELEIGLTRWLALYGNASLDTMLRRNLYEIEAETALSERFLLVSASLGLVLNSPWP